jgi:peptidase E
MIAMLENNAQSWEWAAGEYVIGGSAGALVLRYSGATNSWPPRVPWLQPAILQT